MTITSQVGLRHSRKREQHVQMDIGENRVSAERSKCLVGRRLTEEGDQERWVLGNLPVRLMCLHLNWLALGTHLKTLSWKVRR
jgi:hypothetical protein